MIEYQIQLDHKGDRIMPTVLWTGKLSLPMKLMINTNNILAWLTGNARDATAMKQRIRQSYEGVFSDHVAGYDELGSEFQTKAAIAQLNVPLSPALPVPY
jgi:hypothetical protein